MCGYMPPRIEVDCSQVGWVARLEANVRTGKEADLINFNFTLHGEFCVQLANRYRVEFRLSREPGIMQATIRNTWR